jgi:YVTN family beta-propeller protein
MAPIAGDAVFVINGGDDSISVIDPTTNKVTGTIKLANASWPHHIYLSHDKSMLGVGVPGMDMSGGHHGGMDGMTGAVLVLDAKTGATKAGRTLDAMNHNAAFSPDDSEVWTTRMSTPGKVLVLDAKTLQTKTTIDVGNMPAEVTFSNDGKVAYSGNGGSDTVSVIDIATKKVMTTIDVGDDPVVPEPGNDGKIYVDCEEAKEVAVIDPASNKIILRYALGFHPGMARTAPGGKELWVTNGDDGKLAVFAIGEDKKLAEVTTGAGAHGIAFSGDGKTAYVTNQMADTLSVIDIASRAVTATIAVGKKPNGLLYRSK